MPKKIKTKTEVEKPSKAPARAAKHEREDAAEESGEATGKPEKKNKRKSSIVALKHVRVLKNIDKNLGKTGKPNVQKAMIDAGYKPSYAKNGDIVKTKSWDALMEQHLPDDLLQEVHSKLVISQKLDYMLFTAEIADGDIYELIESVGCVPKKIVHGQQGTHVWFFAPDNTSRLKAVELAYKIKAKLSPTEINLKSGLAAMSDEELAAEIEKEERRLTKTD